jgi:hypothetical protein
MVAVRNCEDNRQYCARGLQKCRSIHALAVARSGPPRMENTSDESLGEYVDGYGVPCPGSSPECHANAGGTTGRFSRGRCPGRGAQGDTRFMGVPARVANEVPGMPSEPSAWRKGRDHQFTPGRQIWRRRRPMPHWTRSMPPGAPRPRSSMKTSACGWHPRGRCRAFSSPPGSKRVNCRRLSGRGNGNPWQRRSHLHGQHPWQTG